MSENSKRYSVERRRGLYCVYDNKTGSKISSHFTKEEALKKIKILNENM